MAYDALTPARFKALKPQFAAVLDATVQVYIDLAGRFVDQSWFGDYEAAWVAMTCHLMTLDGLGTDAASEAHADGTAGFQTIKSADLTLTRFQKAAEDAGNSFTAWLGQTPCGRFYAVLLRFNRAGPRVAFGGCVPIPSGYAKDWPLGTGGWQNGPLS